MVALLVALTVTSSPSVPALSFDSVLFEDVTTHGAGGDAESGGGATVGRKLAFLGLGTALSLSVPLASVPLYVLLGSKLGVDVSWGSALVGAGFGTVTGLALGYVFAVNAPPVAILNLAAFAAGVALGYGLVAPLVTLLDPFALAKPKHIGPTPPDVTIEVVPMSARTMDRVGSDIPLWSGRF